MLRRAFDHASPHPSHDHCLAFHAILSEKLETFVLISLSARPSITMTASRRLRGQGAFEGEPLFLLVHL
jgi:hypothetical protein